MRFISDENTPVSPTSTAHLLVIAAGLPRCATSSLQLAFENHLGLGPTHHMARVMPHTHLCKAWRAVYLEPSAPKRQALLRPLMAGYTSSTDAPSCVVVDDLIDLYPDAKIVLNVRRSREDWFRSMSRTIGPLASRSMYWANYLVPSTYWAQRLMTDGVGALMRRRYGEKMEKGFFSAESYDLHNEWVREVAREKGVPLLEWEAGMGWEPLCEFLGVEVPDAPFPRSNDEKMMKWIVRIVFLRGVLTWMLALSPVVAAGYAVYLMRK